MALKIDIDDSGFNKVLDSLNSELGELSRRVLMEMADTLLVISRMEVPHDTGRLQSSASVFWDGETSGVSYSTEYAAYVHEGMRMDGSHVVQHYQKGRKKKFLEDPLKMNITKWTDIAQDALNNLLS